MLLDKGLSHSAVTYTCVGLNLLFIAFAFYARDWGSTYIILIMIAVAAAGTGLLYYSNNRYRIYVEGNQNGGEPAITAEKILSFRKKNIVAPEDN
jgi:UDP-GlcNAc:undecaprenyl-phosphate/decaprenyl-phosphate GlcNAc-1-phosphate transferase